MKISKRKTKTEPEKVSGAAMKLSKRFGQFAKQASRVAGHPITFLVAVLAISIWALSGPIFDFNENWQLIVNTCTTIMTFLLVILIQNTQNRDTLALQVKLAELVLATGGARNKVAAADEWSCDALEAMLKNTRRSAQRPDGSSNR